MNPLVLVVFLLTLCTGCAFESLSEAPGGDRTTDLGDDSDSDDMGLDDSGGDDMSLLELLTVNTVADVADGSCDIEHCSLRDAIEAAHETDAFPVIDFDIPEPSAVDGADELFVITLSSPLEIRAGMAIVGPFPDENQFVEIRAGVASETVFDIETEESVELESLEITGQGGIGVRLSGPHILSNLTVGNCSAAVIVEDGDGVLLEDLGLGYNMVRDFSTNPNTWSLVVQGAVGRLTMRDSVAVNNTAHGIVIQAGPSAPIVIRDTSVGAIEDKMVQGNGGHGIVIQRPHVQVADSLIGNNGLNGVLIAIPDPLVDDNTVSIKGSRIGSIGRDALPNGLSGVDALSVGDLLIGGPGGTSPACEGECNAIAGNAEAGIRLDGVLKGTVYGNYLGVTDSGSTSIGNGVGIAVTVPENLKRSNGSSCMVGGDCLSGMCREERLSNGTVQNLGGSCTTGCDECDSSVRPRPQQIVIGAGARGGACAGPCNLIGANSVAGIFVGDGNVLVKNNFIGIAETGGSAIPNGSGIVANSVGAALVVEDCLISGNEDYGFLGHAIQTTIRGSTIGLSSNGENSVGNGQGGIHVNGGSQVTVDNCLVGGNGAASVDSDPAIWVDQAANAAPNDAFKVFVVNNRVGMTPTEADASNQGRGIQVGYCVESRVDENTVVHNSETGIVLGSLAGAYSGTVNRNHVGVTSTNTVVRNGGNGIQADAILESSISDNILGGLVQGIVVTGSADVKVEGNEIRDVGAGIVAGLNSNIANFEVVDNTVALRAILPGRAVQLKPVRPVQDAGDLDVGANGLLNYPEFSVTGATANGTVPVIGARIEFVAAKGKSIEQSLDICTQSIDTTGGDSATGENTNFSCQIPPLPATTTLKAITSAKRYGIAFRTATASQSYSLTFKNKTATVASSPANRTQLRDEMLIAIRATFGDEVIAAPTLCPEIGSPPCIDLAVAYNGQVTVSGPGVDEIEAVDAGNVSSELSD